MGNRLSPISRKTINQNPHEQQTHIDSRRIRHRGDSRSAANAQGRQYRRGGGDGNGHAASAEKRSGADRSDKQEDARRICRPEPGGHSLRTGVIVLLQRERHGQRYADERTGQQLYTDTRGRETHSRRCGRRERPESHRPAQHRPYRDCQGGVVGTIWQRRDSGRDKYNHTQARQRTADREHHQSRQPRRHQAAQRPRREAWQGELVHQFPTSTQRRMAEHVGRRPGADRVPHHRLAKQDREQAHQLADCRAADVEPDAEARTVCRRDGILEAHLPPERQVCVVRREDLRSSI